MTSSKRAARGCSSSGCRCRGWQRRKRSDPEVRPMGRLSPHQSVFGLIERQPGESAEARALIEACEARRGRRLPETVRRWYLHEGVVPLHHDANWDVKRECLWYDY